LICVGAFGDGCMGVDGEPDEGSGTDGCSQDKEIPCSLFPHQGPPFQ